MDKIAICLLATIAVGHCLTPLYNSNYFGGTYDIVYGNPLLFTAEDIFNSFGDVPIWEFVYNQTTSGSCGEYSIPNKVFANCIDSRVYYKESLQINDLKTLKESSSSSINLDLSGSFDAFSGSFSYSKQISHMITERIEENHFLTYSNAQVSVWKLSIDMLDPPPFSKSFIKSVEVLPWDEYNKDIYMRFLKAFKPTFMTSMLLGGRAQTMTTMDKHDYEQLIKDHVNIEESAKVDFYISAHGSYKEEYDKESYRKYTEVRKSSGVKSLGGRNFTTGHFDEFADAVVKSPVPISLSVNLIVDLLTKEYFPNDPNIAKKQAFLWRAINEYSTKTPICKNNCTGHGKCVDSGYFQYYQCKCDAGYQGMDCSLTAPCTHYEQQSYTPPKALKKIGENDYIVDGPAADGGCLVSIILSHPPRSVIYSEFGAVGGKRGHVKIVGRADCFDAGCLQRLAIQSNVYNADTGFVPPPAVFAPEVDTSTGTPINMAMQAVGLRPPANCQELTQLMPQSRCDCCNPGKGDFGICVVNCKILQAGCQQNPASCAKFPSNNFKSVVVAYEYK